MILVAQVRNYSKWVPRVPFWIDSGQKGLKMDPWSAVLNHFGCQGQKWLKMNPWSAVLDQNHPSPRGQYEWLAITNGRPTISGNWDGAITNGWWGWPPGLFKQDGQRFLFKPTPMDHPGRPSCQNGRFW